MIIFGHFSFRGDLFGFWVDLFLRGRYFTRGGISSLGMFLGVVPPVGLSVGHFFESSFVSFGDITLESEQFKKGAFR